MMALSRRATLAGGALFAVTLSVSAAAVLAGAVKSDGIESTAMPVAAIGVNGAGARLEAAPPM